MRKFKKEMLQCYFIAGTQNVNHSESELLSKLEQNLKAGITAFQFREKGSSRLNENQKIELGRKIKQKCDKYHIPLIVDDDVDLAKAIKADGIHVGQNDMRIQQVLQEVGPKMIVGYSCNTLDQIKAANKLAVDYVGVGPIFPTISKPDADPAIGVEKLAQIIKLSKHPVVAIGGINANNLAKVAKSGCAGVAVISYLTQSHDIIADINRVKNNFHYEYMTKSIPISDIN